MPRKPAKSVIVAKNWAWQGHTAVLAWIDDKGAVNRVLYDALRVNGEGREWAAKWLCDELLPEVSHEWAYRFLWDDAPKREAAT